MFPFASGDFSSDDKTRFRPSPILFKGMNTNCNSTICEDDIFLLIPHGWPLLTPADIWPLEPLLTSAYAGLVPEYGALLDGAEDLEDLLDVLLVQLLGDHPDEQLPL